MCFPVTRVCHLFITKRLARSYVIDNFLSVISIITVLFIAVISIFSAIYFILQASTSQL